MEYHYTVKKSLLFGKEKPLAFFHINTKNKWCRASLVTLENFSVETFDEALSQLIFVLNSSNSLDDCLARSLYPSVYFFFLNIQKKSFDFSKIATAALIFNPTKEKIEKEISKGFQIIKLKFGNLDVKTLDLIHYFKDNFPRISFRIDFNQKLKLEDCCALLKKLPLESIDYIEEPTHDCYKLAFDFPNKIGLDESLRKTNFLPINYPLVYIIKPLLQPKLDEILSTLIKLKKRTIISSSFELPCGIQTLKWLIKKNGLDHEIHGFDTIKYYDELPCF